MSWPGRTARRGSRPSGLGDAWSRHFVLDGHCYIARRSGGDTKGLHAPVIVPNRSEMMPNISVHAVCNAMIQYSSSPRVFFSSSPHSPDPTAPTP